MPVLLNRPDTAAGIKPVHEARQVPALVQAHADGQAAVEVGLAGRRSQSRTGRNAPRSRNGFPAGNRTCRRPRNG